MQMGVGIRQSVPDVDTDSLLSQNWPPSPPVRWRSCSETDSATTEKHGRKKTEKTVRNATEFLISVDLGKVWPPLVLEAVHSGWSVHLLRGPERPPTIWKTSSNLLLPAANAAIEDQCGNFCGCTGFVANTGWYGGSCGTSVPSAGTNAAALGGSSTFTNELGFQRGLVL